MFKVCIIVLVGLLLPAVADAEIYKYVDESGRVTYTNIPKRGSKKLDLDPISTAKTRNNTGPTNFPRVDVQTQKKRDETRKSILQEELAAEEKLLADAQAALKEGEVRRVGDEGRNLQKYIERVARLKENVSLHEKNISALKKELGDLK